MNSRSRVPLHLPHFLPARLAGVQAATPVVISDVPKENVVWSNLMQRRSHAGFVRQLLSVEAEMDIQPDPDVDALYIP